jgi:secreted trypsin-like serine protease
LKAKNIVKTTLRKELCLKKAILFFSIIFSVLLLESTIAATTNQTKDVEPFIIGGIPVQNVAQFPSFVSHINVTN